MSSLAAARGHRCSIRQLVKDSVIGILYKELTLHLRNTQKTGIVLSNFTFESTLSKVNGEEKRMFITFVNRMIKWNPEERSTAKELLQDPWLHNDFPQV